MNQFKTVMEYVKTRCEKDRNKNENCWRKFKTDIGSAKYVWQEKAGNNHSYSITIYPSRVTEQIQFDNGRRWTSRIFDGMTANERNCFLINLFLEDEKEVVNLFI